jgi:glucosamine-6-phosphate deaminase
MHFIATEDYEAMSKATAQLIAREIKAKPDASIVVAAGNSPLGAYRELARLHDQGKFAVSQLRLFQLDEYLGIPADDPRSLYGWVKRDFLDPLSIPETRMIRLPGDAQDLDAACQQYDARVREAGGFDIAILGLGPNGHLGFNEPPTDPLSLTHTIELSEASIVSNTVYWGVRSRVPRRALTCGMAHLLAARHIFLPVSGAHKSEILWRTLMGAITPDVPGSYLQGNENVVVVADTAAWPHAVPSETKSE